MSIGGSEPAIGGKSKTGVWLVAGVLVTICILLAALAITSHEGDTPEAICRGAVKAILRDPASAEFPDEVTLGSIPEKPKELIGAVTVRANNGFGGKDVEQFYCAYNTETRQANVHSLNSNP